MAVRPPIRLPSQWPRHVKSGILHAISLASVVVAVARGRALGRKRLHAQLDQATAEIALLREELLIKDGRWARACSKRRPHYSPAQLLTSQPKSAFCLTLGGMARQASNTSHTGERPEVPSLRMPPAGRRSFRTLRD